MYVGNPLQTTTWSRTTLAEICMLAVPCRPQNDNDNGNDDDADCNDDDDGDDHDDAVCNDDIMMTVTHITLAEICMLAVPCRPQHDSSCPEENTWQTEKHCYLVKSNHHMMWNEMVDQCVLMLFSVSPEQWRIMTMCCSKWGCTSRQHGMQHAPLLCMRLITPFIYTFVCLLGHFFIHSVIFLFIHLKL